MRVCVCEYGVQGLTTIRLPQKKRVETGRSFLSFIVCMKEKDNKIIKIICTETHTPV